MSITIGSPEINARFDSNEDRELAYDAVDYVFQILKKQGKVRETFYDYDCGGLLYPEDTDLPPGFSYARATLEGYELLKILKKQGDMTDREGAKNFLVGFILAKRGLN